MKFERDLALWAVAACLIPILLWLLVFWSPSFATDQTKWSEFGGFFGGVLSPVLAFVSVLGLLLTIRQQRDAALRQKIQSDDLNYFNHAVSSLERAYATLTAHEPAMKPAADRLAWLSCARLLLSASDVSDKISASSTGLLALYEGEEEHWRSQFYELLNPTGTSRVGRDASYFRHPELINGVAIEERSIRVIFEFSAWPAGKPDPIDRVPKYTLVELESMNAGMSGVREYLKTLPRGRERGNG